MRRRARGYEARLENKVIASDRDIVSLPLTAVPVRNTIGCEWPGRQRSRSGIELAGASVSSPGYRLFSELAMDGETVSAQSFA